jgi:23S rRNA C2498 (ribose-2'-O)-methylase RlmM
MSPELVVGCAIIRRWSLSVKKQSVFVARAGYADLLQQELADLWKIEGTVLGDDALALSTTGKIPHYNETVFARQFLPQAIELPTKDYNKLIDAIFERLNVAYDRPNRKNCHWTLHAFALEDNAANKLAGKIEKDLMARIRAKSPVLFKKFLSPEDMADRETEKSDWVLQVYVQSIYKVWFSTGSFTSGISRYVGGILRMKARAGTPSRSGRKLEEALHEMNYAPKEGETAVDLGAAPGGWSFVLARNGASVTSVDALDMDLPNGKDWTKRIEHLRSNGLTYEPSKPVDWMCCDMIIASDETLKVLKRWLDKGLMNKFVVNLKLPKNDPWGAIKRGLDLLATHEWKVKRCKHLFHDRHEVTLFGIKS